MAYGHVESCYVVLHNSKPRRPTYFEVRKLLCQEIASHSQQLEGELTEAKINQAHVGWAFAFRAETSQNFLTYQLHVSRQRAKKSKNKRNRWQSDWENVLHRSNSSLPVWELSFAPSEQLTVTSGAEILKQHNCVIVFWLSSYPWQKIQK